MDDSSLLGHDVPGAVDHLGHPASRSSTGGWGAAIFIIGVEVAERFAYYGASSNLINYLTGPLQQPTAAAAAAVNVWSGVSMMLPLLGAFIADSYLGRYRTIVGASILYVLGLAMLTISVLLPAINLHESSNSSTSRPTTTQVVFFYSSLYLIALAQGGHKPCVQAFGADQFDQNNPNESNSRSSFFNWWYFALSGSIGISIFTMSYVQDDIGWALGFGIPCIAMVLGFLVFLFGTRTYRYYLLEEANPFVRVAKACTALIKNRQFRDESIAVNQLEEAKGLLRLLPLWATCLMFGIVSAQSFTFFTKQANTLNRTIIKSFQLPPAALLTFVSIAVVLFVPIYDRILVPLARNLSNTPSGLTTLQRIGTGIFFSVIMMVTAALVETKRLKIARDYGLLDEPGTTLPMSFWWLVPQYLIFGIANVFTLVGMQEFFYDQVPDAMRSLGLALYLSVTGVGSLMSGVLVWLLERATERGGRGWFSDNLNRDHLDYFYWLLAGLSVIGFLMYLFFALSYVYKKNGNTVM